MSTKLPFPESAARIDRRRLLQAAGIGAAAMALPGCLGTSSEEVVVYSALDREFSDPVLQDYGGEAGVRVLPKYDVESTKTVGLVELLIEEAPRPRCDLFWNNEILHSLRLQELGLLASYATNSRKNYPAWASSTDDTWQGFAARARIFVVNTELAAKEDRLPTSVLDLADERFAGKCAIAKPLFGTTASHAAVLFAQWGESEATRFFEQVAKNARVVSGNRQVAASVASGETLFGVTDTDDAIVEIEAGSPVEIVYPDQAADQMGTLLIPNTLCLIANGPNPERARALFDWLLRPEIEDRLAKGASAQIPLHADATVRPRVVPDPTPGWAEPSFEAAAKAWNAAAEKLRTLFATSG